MIDRCVEIYLQELESSLQDKYGELRIPKDCMKAVLKQNMYDMSGYRPISKISHDGLDIFLKTYSGFHMRDPRRRRSKFSTEIFLSRLYNTLGVPSVTYYPVYGERGVFSKETVELMASQSLLNIPGYKTKQANTDDKLAKIVNYMCIYDTYTIDNLIKYRSDLSKYDDRFADDKFFSEFVLMHIMDNICLQTDRTLENFFTYTDLTNRDKGIIVYDHERTDLDKFVETDIDKFRAFLDASSELKCSFVPQSICPVKVCGESYDEKLKGIRDILNSDVLGKYGDQFRNSLAKLDFSKLVRSAEDDARYSLEEDYIRKTSYLLSKASVVICSKSTDMKNNTIRHLDSREIS